MIIFFKDPKRTILFDLKHNQIITSVIGLSGNSILKIKHKKTILIDDDDKIVVFNYKTCKLIDVCLFHEIYYIKKSIIRNIKVCEKDYTKYEEEKFQIIYKNKIIANVNALKLKYILENYKDIKYDYIINKDNYIIKPKMQYKTNNIKK